MLILFEYMNGIFFYSSTPSALADESANLFSLRLQPCMANDLFKRFTHKIH